MRPMPKAIPRHYELKIKGMLADSMRHIREDVEKESDPKAKALFETLAEVIGGLIAAYDHFEQRSEATWKQ